MVLTFFVLLASLASAVLWTTASRADEPVGPPPTVVVQPNDSLWSIAERVAPDRAPLGVIDDIRQLNDIDDWYVYAGETLVVPRGR
ncbi:LysM peptidoglycan-binding domain-containing protein [Actinoplanes sp. NPDC049316]|uniref:LysM peptidoglycan-binding domain-containing protein n=1 Tax=Actinoplanes sp. NPDC049316 TaxID=3154727 RepID=UPI00343D6404